MKIIYKEGEGEIEEKKSRFIAHVYPVQSEEQAVSYINEVKKKYWDARHNCYAYVLGEDAGFQRLVTMESRRGQQENRFLTLL